MERKPLPFQSPLRGIADETDCAGMVQILDAHEAAQACFLNALFEVSLVSRVHAQVAKTCDLAACAARALPT